MNICNLKEANARTALIDLGSFRPTLLIIAEMNGMESTLKCYYYVVQTSIAFWVRHIRV